MDWKKKLAEITTTTTIRTGEYADYNVCEGW